MRKTTGLAIVFACGMAVAAVAEPALGTWKTQVDDGNYAHVVMSKCGANICGKIARTFNASGEFASSIIGKTLVMDMVPQGGGAYKGRVWRPSNDKVYIGKMVVSGDRLKLSGCVAGGLICAKQDWTRVN